MSIQRPLSLSILGMAWTENDTLLRFVLTECTEGQDRVVSTQSYKVHTIRRKSMIVRTQEA
jgi:hypothetical protein